MSELRDLTSRMLAFHLFWVDFSQVWEYLKKTPSHSFTNEKGFPPGDSILAKIMTTKKVSEYLKLHEITICKYAAHGKIPAIRIGKAGDLIK